MFKKQSSTVKEKSHAVKKQPSSFRKTQSHKKETPHEQLTHKAHSIFEKRVNLLPPELMADTMKGITSLMNNFTVVANNNLNALQRSRKIGPGIRNYGFLEKVADFAEANPQFAQFFRPADLRNCIRNIEMCRDLSVLLQSFARSVTNSLLLYSDDAKSMSLIYYNIVKELFRYGEPTAMELFKSLRTFFKRTRRADAKQTEKKIKKDVHALMSGKKDGKIIIENVNPKLTVGSRKVIKKEIDE